MHLLNYSFDHHVAEQIGVYKEVQVEMELRGWISGDNSGKIAMWMHRRVRGMGISGVTPPL